LFNLIVVKTRFCSKKQFVVLNVKVFSLFLVQNAMSMLVKVFGSAVFGVEATTITVDVVIVN
jgi:hypothetical protein